MTQITERYNEYRCTWCGFVFWDLWVRHEDPKYCQICGSPNAQFTFLGKAWHLQHQIEYRMWVIQRIYGWANLNFVMASFGFAFMVHGFIQFFAYLFGFFDIPQFEYANGIDFMLNAPTDNLIFHPLSMCIWGTALFLIPVLTRYLYHKVHA